MNKLLSGIAASALLTVGSAAYAVPVKCTVFAGPGDATDCRVDAGDTLNVPPLLGTLVVGNSGNDNEATVEAAIFTRTGVAVDLSLLGKSDQIGGYGDAEAGLSGDWSIPGMASYITVKAANSFNLFEIDPAAMSGLWNTNDILNGGDNQPGVSHISYWSAPDRPPGGLVPEPGSMALLGLGLVALGLRRRRRA